MASSTAPAGAEQTQRPTPVRETAAHRILALMEGLVLLLVCVSPWPYGSVHPGFELLLYAGLALLLLLWAAWVLLAGQVSWQTCTVTFCLGGLFLAGLGQLAPVPRSVLGWLAPGTARLYDELLPSVPEQLPGGEALGNLPFEPGSTLSLYPAATRADLVRLLAVFVVFAVVRQCLASAGALRRLSVVALVNGAALALFALVQFWTSPPNTLYWSYPSIGVVFGPFVNRNHFAFYENLCLGLGLGLLLSRQAAGPAPADSRRRSGRGGDSWRPAAGVLHDVLSLWICLALALILCSVAVCVSRGGFWALLGAAVVSAVLWGARGRRGQVVGRLLLVLVPAVLLVVWLGLDRVTARLETTWAEDDQSRQERVEAWLRVLPLAADFPLWGTGLGTFAYVEPLQRTNAASQRYLWDHAHNEYLEALVEGGLLRLLLSLAAIVLVYRCGAKVLRRPESPAAAGLALGALFGFSAVVLHSFGEFGLHIPAIALLTAVLCAQLCGLAAATNRDGERPAGLRLGGLAAPLAAVTAVVLGLVLAAEGWKAYRADRLQAAQRGQSVAAEERIARLGAANRLSPGDAKREYELAQAHLQEYRKQGVVQVRRSAPQGVAGIVAALSPSALPTLAPQSVLASLTGEAAPVLALVEQLDKLDRAHLFPALRHLLRARNACPLLPGPQLELAAHADRLRLAKNRTAYLERAQRVAPGDPNIWFRSGVLDLAWLQPQRTWGEWRRSLELSDAHLEEILEASSQRLPPAQVLDLVIPDRPGLLVRVAARLFPAPDGLEQQKPYLERALTLYRQQTAPKTAADLHTLGQIYDALGEPQGAAGSYRAALDREPRRTEWRLELAGLLYRSGQLREALREVKTVREQQPGDIAARELEESVAHDIAKGGR